MSTHDQRRLAFVKRESISKLAEFPHWLSLIRERGIREGMTIKEAEDRFNPHTVEEIFESHIHPDDAYEELTNTDNIDKQVDLRMVIKECKANVLYLAKIIQEVEPNHTSVSRDLMKATKLLNTYHHQFKILYNQ